MIKKCMGCGLTLQNTNEEAIGYTPNLNNDYCKRCFRLRNYGEKKDEALSQEKQNEIIKKAKNGLIFAFISYYELNKRSLDLFKSLASPKILVVSKSDTIRQEIKFTKIESWLREVYDLKEDILFLSNKSKTMGVNIFKYLDKYQLKTAYIMGLTNSGKSTFLNNILKKNNINREILVSDKANTTLDFIKIKIDDYLIYDTPGFNLEYDTSFNCEVKPISLNITKPTVVEINEAKFYFGKANNIVIYSAFAVKRSYDKPSLTNSFKLQNNEDIVFKYGFINVKLPCEVYTNLTNIEVRKNISSEE